MNPHTDVYNNSMYRMLFWLQKFNFNGAVFFILLFLDLLMTFVIGMVCSTPSRTAADGYRYASLIMFVEFMVIFVCFRGTPGATNTQKELLKCERKSFGCQRTPDFVLYCLYNVLYLDVFKNVWISLVFKIISCVAVGYGIYSYLLPYLDGFWVCSAFAIFVNFVASIEFDTN